LIVAHVPTHHQRHDYAPLGRIVSFYRNGHPEHRSDRRDDGVRFKSFASITVNERHGLTIQASKVKMDAKRHTGTDVHFDYEAARALYEMLKEEFGG
jgi:hypothetical protein